MEEEKAVRHDGEEREADGDVDIDGPGRAMPENYVDAGSAVELCGSHAFCELVDFIGRDEAVRKQEPERALVEQTGAVGRSAEV